MRIAHSTSRPLRSERASKVVDIARSGAASLLLDRRHSAVREDGGAAVYDERHTFTVECFDELEVEPDKELVDKFSIEASSSARTRQRLEGEVVGKGREDGGVNR